VRLVFQARMAITTSAIAALRATTISKRSSIDQVG
jgi:hypothetical protein